MPKSFKLIATAIVATALAIAPAFAAQSPAGTWQTVSGESRFEVTLCGDGTEVCARLVWLRDDARTADNLSYLNSYVLKGAKRALENKWRGSAEYMGEVVKGTLTLVDGNTMTINGCKGALCQKFELTRI
ncbi:hypothetical protein ASC89_08235 [Devosia sp. Root413D1]|uniref:DUF2147 domain-containing protein n=1 Tax=unclassified Devosia TaxID=196773 RepID=UPI0006F2312D|nr:MULTISPECIES: DUF2147 domain-containing protein [unclassified Devosia]KQU93979.1 hypothetical protein ASC68_20090 [Devosia sp. Root105]KQW80086.1 hypothetical protein ASC89_08235 [Devosia sp. Root413D1]HVL08722.1 DUF2147 domain-containing protein [Burkholderiaceae bacterium]